MHIWSAITTWTLSGCVVLAAEAVDVSISEGRGCALYDDGKVFCWGVFPGDEGLSLPFEAHEVSPLPYSIAISTGRFGACAVSVEHELWCWGLDYQRSKRTDEAILTRVPFQVEGLPAVKAVDMGFAHNCALSLSGEAWCWGSNTRGEVGSGDRETKSEPTRVPHIFGATAISAGINNTCAIENQQLVCWGSDNPTMDTGPFIYESNDPMLLNPDMFGLFDTVSNGRNFGCGINVEGSVTCWGSNLLNQLGTERPRIGSSFVGIGEVEGIDRAVDIDTSYFNSCAVSDGKVFCWGSPLFGVPSGENMSQATTQVPNIQHAEKVSLGDSFACAISDRKVFCWGSLTQTGEELIEGMGPETPVSVPGLPE